jgi:hypothetical protein
LRLSQAHKSHLSSRHTGRKHGSLVIVSFHGRNSRGRRKCDGNAAQTRPILATLIIIKTPHTRHTTQGGPIGYRAKGPRPASWERQMPKGDFRVFIGNFKKKNELKFLKSPPLCPLDHDRAPEHQSAQGRGQSRVNARGRARWQGHTDVIPVLRVPTRGYIDARAHGSFGYARDSRAAYTVDADGVGRAEQMPCAACHRLPRQLFIRTMRTSALAARPRTTRSHALGIGACGLPPS